MPASPVDVSAAAPGSDNESSSDVEHEEQVQQSGEQEHIDTKLAESTWQAMQIGAASSDSERNPVSDALRLLMKHGKLVLLSVTVVVLVLSVIASVFTPSSGALQRGQPLPRDLPAAITRATHASAAAGLLKPIATSCRRVHDGGIDFIVSTVSAARQAEKAAKSNLTPGAADGGAAPTAAVAAATAAAAAAAARDPFARESRDARMVVAPRVPPEHVLVLNKFPTLAGHALLVTDAFREQATPLTAGDFAAWYAVVAAADAVGFFNSAAEAGASQRHKHMQLVPLASFAPCTQSRGLPIDSAISMATARTSTVTAANDSEAAIFRLPNFKFKHGLTLLPPESALLHGGGGDGGGAGMPLLAIYSALLRRTGLLDCAAAPGDCAFAGGAGSSGCGDSGGGSTVAPAAALAPHNVLLTTRWMLVVPRARAGCAGVNVNGLGFMGSLLVHADGDGGGAGGAPDVKPMSVLSCVTVPDAP